MVSIERIFKELSQEEGVENKIYKCSAGHRTIGVGHNLDARGIDDIIGRKLANNPVLTNEEIQKVLEFDVNKFKTELDKQLPWWKDLSIPSQYVLLSLCFNMGIGGQIQKNPPKYNGLRGFVNTLKAFEEHRYDDAASGLEQSKWYKQVGTRSVKLTKILRTQKFPDGKSE